LRQILTLPCKPAPKLSFETFSIHVWPATIEQYAARGHLDSENTHAWASPIVQP
jgi:hypothetical protein